jgi:hypothetical protein
MNNDEALIIDSVDEKTRKKPSCCLPTNRTEKREGLEAVKYFVSKGVPVKEFYAQGEDSDPSNYSLEIRTKGKISRYKICLIGRMIVLDIDRKKYKDGVSDFYKHLSRLGISKEMLPSYLQDIAGGSYPFYMSTPSNGFHLYFRYLGKCPDSLLCENVEIKNKQVSAGYKDGQPYVLHGEIEDMQRIPPFLLERMLPKQVQVKEARKKFRASLFFREKNMSLPSWDRIVEWTDKDGKGTEGRNARAFWLAIHAKKHGYSKEAALACLEQDSSVNTLHPKELLGVVKSVYERTR